jgi:hypothetical protein
VLLFKRILNFSGQGSRLSEKRKAQRFVVGHPFPFKAVLTILGKDAEGKAVQNDNTGVDWAGRLANLSAIGASIQLHSAAIGVRGARCVLSFSRDDYLLRIPGNIAYLRSYPQYMLCGFSFAFPNAETQKAYLQLLEPVSLGASLSTVDPRKVRQDEDGLHKELYKGPAAAQLAVLRQGPGGPVQSFDFLMNDYGVRWAAGSAEVEPYGVARSGSLFSKASPAAGTKLSPTQLQEVRWLFRLAIPNLPKAVPSDIRKLLAQVVA